MPELRGRNPCLWIGEDETGACLKLDDRCGNLHNVVRDGEPVPCEVDTLADVVYDALREKFELPSGRAVAQFVGVVLAALALWLAVLTLGPKIAAKIIVIGVIGGITFGAAKATQLRYNP